MAKKPQGDIAIYFGDKQNTGEYDNGVWMDILDIPFITKIEEAEYYRTIIHTMWIVATGWHKEIKSRWPGKTLIGLSDHPLSTHISKMGAEGQVAYIRDLDYLDGIMALTDEEQEWYQTAAPSRIVKKVGLPFPTEKYEARFGHLRNQERKYIGLGVGAGDNDRNFISSVTVFSKLKILYPELEAVFLSIPSNLVSYCGYLADNFPGIYIHERTDMEGFYTILNQCKFVINLADRNTPGRIQGEGAFFEIPIIGSNRLELQNELFPKLSVTPYQTESAFNRAVALLENPDVGQILAQDAHKKLEKYNYKKSKARFKALLREIESQG